jgi:hypothetical protein
MKHIKSNQIGCVASVIISVLALSAASVFAADNGNIILSGTVAAVSELTISPVAGYNALNLTTGGADVQVATVNEKNNDPDGYTVTLQSLNAGATTQGFLKGSDTENSQFFNYTMKYGTAAAEAAVTLVAGSAIVSTTSAPSIEAGAEKSLLISFTGSSWKNADSYSDTITLTIAAK